MFAHQSSSSSSSEGDDSSGNGPESDDLEALMLRPEVSEFISSVNASIDESICKPSMDIVTSSSSSSSSAGNKVSRVSVGNPLVGSPSYSKRSLMYSPLRDREHPRHRNNHPSHHLHSNGINTSATMYSPACAFPGVSGAYLQGPMGHDSILAAFPAISNAITHPSSEATFEESEKLIARMIDVRHEISLG